MFGFLGSNDLFKVILQFLSSSQFFQRILFLLDYFVLMIIVDAN